MSISNSGVSIIMITIIGYDDIMMVSCCSLVIVS